MKIFSPLRQLLNGLKKLCLEIFIPNRRIRRIMKGDMAKSYLKKYVKSAIKEADQVEYKKEEIKDYFQNISQHLIYFYFKIIKMMT